MRRAFVVTASVVLGCQPKPAPETIKNDNPPKVEASSSSSTVATADPPKDGKATKKRKRTAAAAPYKAAKTPPGAKLTPIQVKDGAGHPLFIGEDDRCYYELPAKGTPPPMPTGSRWVDQFYVDCPAEADDPAWDDCSNSTLYSVSGVSTCECYQTFGNPPPPPREVACPKK